MFVESWLWLICPLVFFGMMVLCFVFNRKSGYWSCCSPRDDRYSNDERIRRMEEEIRRLKGDR